VVRVGVLQYGDWVAGGFTLMNGTDPTDWFYAQHGLSFVSTRTTGKFTLAAFHNGDDRVFPSGVTGGTTGEPPCLCSAAPVIEIDGQTAKTATLGFNPTAPSYAFWGGNSAVLSNGNLEFCESAGGPNTIGDIYEVTQRTASTRVWRMMVGLNAYRGQRIPGLYLGVQW
jgi:arylsulfate sulfotransferase